MLSRVSTLFVTRRGLGGSFVGFRSVVDCCVHRRVPVSGVCSPCGRWLWGHTGLPGCGHTVLSGGIFLQPRPPNISPSTLKGPWEKRSRLGLPRQKPSISGRMALEQSYDGRHQSPVLSCDVLAPWPLWLQDRMKEHVCDGLGFLCASSGKQGKTTRQSHQSYVS